MGFQGIRTNEWIPQKCWTSSLKNSDVFVEEVSDGISYPGFFSRGSFSRVFLCLLRFADYTDDVSKHMSSFTGSATLSPNQKKINLLQRPSCFQILFCRFQLLWLPSSIQRHDNSGQTACRCECWWSKMVDNTSMCAPPKTLKVSGKSYRDFQTVLRQILGEPKRFGGL